MAQDLSVYAQGDVVLYHPGIDATMAVPEDTVEIWKASGWKKATDKMAREAKDKEE